jgi:hypothetical protein
MGGAGAQAERLGLGTKSLSYPFSQIPARPKPTLASALVAESDWVWPD